MTQHAFIIAIEQVFPGTFEEAFKLAVEEARRIDNENGDAHILVTETGNEYLSNSAGVFCEGCEGHPFSGVRWPTMISSDDSREWLQRCDRCEQYDSDEAAMKELLSIYGDDNIKSYGCIDGHCFVETK